MGSYVQSYAQINMTTSTTSTSNIYGLTANWYTPASLAPLVGMSAATVRAAVRAGHVRTHRKPGPKARIRILQADALAWLEGMGDATPAEVPTPAPKPTLGVKATPGSRKLREGITLAADGVKVYA